MSLAEKIRLEGELRGKLEGELQGKLETAQNMILEGSDPVFLMKVTKLPLNKIKELQAKQSNLEVN